MKGFKETDSGERLSGGTRLCEVGQLLFWCFGWEGRDEGRCREGRRGVYLWPLDVPEPVS
ncbi:hypothetical protein ADH70_012120 [Blautia pseudococcoides]|uniref:Uncharacterized protein n=1 Tax=Blautia pseudococcoides TaxID=1796616 RepID=A0A1C7IEV6_9FIRM|nr:hypothetical protein A4V09_13635 [Blautia pseudococcoides]ASU29518.1 hypothetical protein ADH70_012120 [Blautia pseudococcoides]